MKIKIKQYIWIDLPIFFPFSGNSFYMRKYLVYGVYSPLDNCGWEGVTSILWKILSPILSNQHSPQIFLTEFWEISPPPPPPNCHLVNIFKQE